MKYLITGGAGFIGSHLVDKLLSEGNDIVVVDNFDNYYDVSQKKDNVKAHQGNTHYHLYVSDIENKKELERIFHQHQFDAVIHLAARAGVRRSLENPASYIKTNILGTLNVLECTKENGTKKLVVASSSSVYGNCTAEKFSEDLIVSQPISPYAMTKSACEQLCYTFHLLYGLNIMVLRPFTVYGPRMRPDLAIYKFIKKMSLDQPIQVYGDGTTKRDYTYIDDIVAGFKNAINYTKTSFEIINLGSGKPITLKDMIQVIEKSMGKQAKTDPLPQHPGDVDKTSCDLSKAHLLLNYTPQTSFETGILKTIEWFKTSVK